MRSKFFSRDQGPNPIDRLHGLKAKRDGYYSYVRGVDSEAVRFDGYTMSLTIHIVNRTDRRVRGHPKLCSEFSNMWLAFLQIPIDPPLPRYSNVKRGEAAQAG